MLDLRLLETFREVATRGSFSAAAEALSFTQPAVSQHVAKLERRLGAKLLERDTRGVRLTPPGEALLRHAETLLEGVRAAEAEVRSQAGLHVPEVRIGSFQTGAAGLVPMALRELRSARPDVRPKLRIVDDAQAIEELTGGRIDVGLALGSLVRPLPQTAGIEAELVLEDPMLIALPSTHPFARRPAIDLQDLRDEEWMLTDVGGTCEDSNIVLHACSRAGFAPRINFESEDYNALLGLAASGMGITIIPSLAATSVPTEVVVRPIAGEAPKRLVYAVHRSGELPDEVEVTIEALRIAGRRLSMGLVAAA